MQQSDMRISFSPNNNGTSTESTSQDTDAPMLWNNVMDRRYSAVYWCRIAKYMTYCTTYRIQPNINTYLKTPIVFAKRHNVSPGTASICFHLQRCWLELQVHLLPLYSPFLLSLQDMDRLGIYFDSLTNNIIHKGSGYALNVIPSWCHALVTCNPTKSFFSTKMELGNLHRCFGNPQFRKLANFLEQATGRRERRRTYKLLERIAKHCQYYQTYGYRTKRFKRSLRDPSVHLKNWIYCDILTLDKENFLHIVDEATRFQPSCRLINMYV